MSPWAKRGLQAAVFTGGMLALGVGAASAASAAECCPDRPGTPTGGSVDLPIYFGDNALGTPLGEVEPEAVDMPLGTAPVEEALGSAEPPNTELPGRDVDAGDDPFRGDEGRLDVAMPVHVAGNAVGIGGDADVENSSALESSAPSEIETGSGDDPLGGNVIAGSLAAPVVVTGNAGGFLDGDATSTSDASTATQAGGPVRTDGTDQVLAGNVVHWPGAIPVEFSGNAVSWLGSAETDSTSATSADSGGDVESDGARGVGSGNVGGGPLAVPLQGNGNAVAWIANADSASSSQTSTTAAGENRTDGRESVLGGNLPSVPVSAPAELFGNGVSWIGNATGEAQHTKTSDAGGFVGSNGTDATGGGNVAQVPVSLPVQGFGNGASWIGTADADALGVTSSTSGGDATTSGEGGAFSGDIAAVPTAGAAQLFGNAAALTAVSDAAAVNETDVESGGDLATDGTDGSVAGSIVEVPLTPVAQGFGNAATVGGGSGALADNTTTVTNDGDRSTTGEGFLTGASESLPLSALAQGYDLEPKLLGQADADATDATELLVDGDILEFIFTGSDLPELSPTDIPELPSAGAPTERTAYPSMVLPGTDVLMVEDLGGGSALGSLDLAEVLAELLAISEGVDA